MAAVRSRARKPAAKVEKKGAQKVTTTPAKEPALNLVILPEARVELCASKGDVRYYLNWAYLDLSDKTQPMLVASNGRILAAAPVTIEGAVTAGPIPVEAIKAARAVKTTQPQIGARLIFEGDMCGTRDVMYRRPANDFKYPDWRSVVPQLPKSTTPDIGLNGDYIATIQKVLKGRKYGGLKFTMQRDEKNAIVKNKAVLLQGYDAEFAGAVAVVMPMAI